jgi:23S rRNA (cytosine1962-C5)-methyltransferase
MAVFELKCPVDKAHEKSAALLHLRISPTAEWKLRSGHPWLYSESILQENREGKLGELAVIYDRHDNFLALGLYDPTSPLRVRVLLTGNPQPIDLNWWQNHLGAAVHRRDGLFDAQTTGYRWINGESDGWPGLVLDRYERTVVMKLYSAAWLPRLAELTNLVREGVLMRGSASSTAEALDASLAQPERLVLRLSRNIQPLAHKAFGVSDGQVLYGPELQGPVLFLESGLRFEAEVARGQKTGFFLDQRENRRCVESLARGRQVLNAFSYSGGFSLYAARGGAVAATDLDISPHALASGQRNFELNRSNPAVANCHYQSVQADAFEWLNQAKPQFDLIVLDPPSLAKREMDRSRALNGYGHLVRQALVCLRRDGILVAASCSAHVSSAEFFEMMRQTARKSGRQFTELQTTSHPPDHPATFQEARYLKAIYFRFQG